MEALLDAADALVRTGDEPQRPDFRIPEEYASIPTEQLLDLRRGPQKGKGWFARQDIPSGTILMVAKPVGMVMDWQDDTEEVVEEVAEREDDDGEDAMEDEDDDREPRLNELLLIQLLEQLKQEPNLWKDSLSTLFPRNNADLSKLPAWVCEDDAVFMKIESLILDLEKLPELKDAARDISKRLPLIIRYNILSIETCPELLSHPGPEGHASLSGVGLYHLPSFFNHSSRPNCSRWAIGDVMAFVSNQNITAGEEVCISYIEHDVLCETAYRRNLMLRMDFDDIEGMEDATANYEEEEGPDLPVIDSGVQNELMGMDPFERLSAIDELMQQATGAKVPEGEAGAEDQDAMEMTGTSWFKCDVQNLRILRAITLDGMGQSKEALRLWEESVAFSETELPPADESTVVMRVQAALCAWHIGDDNTAKGHAEAALRVHNLLFGGGVSRFRRRLASDLRLPIRPDSIPQGIESSSDALWPLLY